MFNFLKRKKQPQLPDWQSDWLYHLVFQKVEDTWETSCMRSTNPDYWQYVLVEEWSDSEDADCRGTLLRSWLRDAQGLRQIPLETHDEHKSKIRGGIRIWPLILFSFHVYPDKTHVVIGRGEASTAGSGFRYLVIGDPDNAQLVRDPSGGFWVS